MLQWSQQLVEAGLAMLSIVHLYASQARHTAGVNAHSLIGSQQDTLGINFIVLAALALWTESHVYLPAHGTRYRYRSCKQLGLLQGLLAVPTLVVAIAIRKTSRWWLQLGCTLLCASFQQLTWLLHSATHTAGHQSWKTHAGNAQHGRAAVLGVSTTGTVQQGANDTAIYGVSAWLQRAGGLVRRRAARSTPSDVHATQDRPRTTSHSSSGFTAASGLHRRRGPPAEAQERRRQAQLQEEVQKPPSSIMLLCCCALYVAVLQALTGMLSLHSTPVQRQHADANMLHSHGNTSGAGSVRGGIIPTPAGPLAALLQLHLQLDVSRSAALTQMTMLLGAVPALHTLNVSLPGTFTPGEACIIAQALLLVFGSSLSYLLSTLRWLGPSHLLWSPHIIHPDPSMRVPAFVLLVMFWVLLLVLASSVAAALVRHALHAQRHKQRSVGADSQQHETSNGGGTQSSSKVGPAIACMPEFKTGLAVQEQPAAEPDNAHSVLSTRMAPAALLGVEKIQSCWQCLPRHQRALLMLGLLGMALCLLMLADLAVWVLGRFVAASTVPRLKTLGYWALCLGFSVPFMYLVSKASGPEQADAGSIRSQPSGAAQARTNTVTPGSGHAHGSGSSMPVDMPKTHKQRLLQMLCMPHIVMRKGYHVLAILLFLPSFAWDLRMLQASLAIAAGVLVGVELLRCVGPYWLSHAIQSFMHDFADSRDSGPIYVTHFTLLLGIAVPVWLCDAVCMPALEASSTFLMQAGVRMDACTAVIGLSGLVSLGAGDTMAACVGFLLGKLKLFPGGKKTVEGTLSGVAAMLLSWAAVLWCLDVWQDVPVGTWLGLAGVSVCVGLLEAVTEQLDNVVVPIYYCAHLVLLMRS